MANVKQGLYAELIRRMDNAYAQSMFFESSWYAYTVLEDRLLSLLRNSGGDVSSKGKTIRMMGPKLQELTSRANSNTVLNSNFEHDDLNDWKDSRNDLMHAMADGSLSIAQIDAEAEDLAKRGRELVGRYTAAARRQKRYVTKVAKTPSVATTTVAKVTAVSVLGKKKGVKVLLQTAAVAAKLSPKTILSKPVTKKTSVPRSTMTKSTSKVASIKKTVAEKTAAKKAAT